MKLRIITFVLFTSLAFTSKAQGRFFIGSDGDYSMLINQEVTPKSTKPETGGYVDYYILKQKNEFAFLLSVRKVGLTSDPNFIYEEGFTKGFLDECECEFLESKKIAFRNFNGIRIKIKTSLEGNAVYGHTVGVVSSGILFNINFLAVSSKFDLFVPEFEKIMNTLVFR
jgi:hypothetical protein